LAKTLTTSFLRKLNYRQAPAVILGEPTSHTLGFVRSLGGREIPVVAISTKPPPKIRSRYCAGFFGVDGEAALLEFLEQIAGSMPRVGALIATGDREMLFLSRNRQMLDKHYRFVLPSAEILERLANKRSQYRYAGAIGIPIPATYYPSTQRHVEQIASMIRFPCVIKPAHSHIWRDRRREGNHWERLKATEVATPGELCSAYSQMSQSEVELLVQERIAGSESRLYSLYAYLNRKSEPLASCVIQKLRQWPPEYGSGSYSVSCREDKVAALGLRLLRETRYVGLANVEFKLDLDSNAFKLIEVNIRSGERIALAIAAGVDIPHIAYRDILGEPVDAVGDYKTGIKWVNFVNDAAAFLCHYRKQMSWRCWVRSLSLARSHAYFSWKDPLPFIEHILQTSRKIALMLYRHLHACGRRPAALRSN
jgi:predicted ATP-grasp superfamily ATP-dependent carboligase